MNPSPKQVAKEAVEKHLCYPFDEEKKKYYLMGSLRANEVIEVLATAISKAVEDETIRCANVAESWMAVSHEMGRDIAKAIRSKKEVRG